MSESSSFATSALSSGGVPTSSSTATEAGSSTSGSVRSTTFSASTIFPSPTTFAPSSPVKSSIVTPEATPTEAIITTGSPSGADTLSTAVLPTESVNRPVQSFTAQHASGSRLTTLQTVAIAISIGVFLLIILALVLFLLRRSRRRSSKQNGPPSKNVDAETVEKYGGASEYTHLQYRQVSAETKGSNLSPHGTSFDNSRRSSRYSGDFAMYRDSPPSPFVNGEIEMTHEPLTHAISLGDATPFSQLIEEAQFDMNPTVLPNPHESPKRTVNPSQRSPMQLAPLVIPSSYNALGRKPTNGTGKRVSRRGSKHTHTYQAVDGGNQSDVDTESMYSQASAYSTQSILGPESPQDAQDMTMSTVSTVHPLDRLSSTAPLRVGAEKRDSSVSTIRARDIVSTRSSPTTPTYPNPHPRAPHPHGSVDSAPSEHGTETTDDLSRENTVVVAQLLQSRGRIEHAHPPERSASLVSHIERKGSIRPAIKPLSGDGQVGRRGVRNLRALRKSRGSRSGMGGLVGIPQDPASPGWDSGAGSGQ